MSQEREGEIFRDAIRRLDRAAEFAAIDGEAADSLAGID